MRNHIEQFKLQVAWRWRAGQRQYEDRSFNLSARSLFDEIGEELIDVWNWSAILLTNAELSTAQRAVVHAVRLGAAGLYLILQHMKPKDTI